MAHIYFNESSQYGRKLRSMLNLMEQADLAQVQVRSTMIQMLDGDGSQDAHYTTIMNRFGFESVKDARAAFAEMDSAFSKTADNRQVSDVRAARDQLMAKLR